MLEDGRAQRDMEVEEVLRGCAYMPTIGCSYHGWQNASLRTGATHPYQPALLMDSEPMSICIVYIMAGG